MPPARVPTDPSSASDQVLEAPDTTLLDLLDRVLSKGVMADGDLTIGVAGVDLIYVRLAALICAADRVLPAESLARTQRKRRRRSPVRTRR